jgi:GNAT superfamily N-acetyltransferase
MQLLRVTERSSRLFADSMAIIRRSISGNTQLPQERLEQLLTSGRYRLFAYVDGQEASGAALLYFAEHPGFVWLDYFAIRSDLRGQGLGGDLFRQIIAATARQNASPDWLLLEVDDDRDGDAQHQATCGRRIAFYRRLGARLLENVPYRFPSAFGEPVPMRLMAYPVRSGARLTEDELKGMVGEVFLNIHGRSQDDELLRWFGESMPKEIEAV